MKKVLFIWLLVISSFVNGQDFVCGRYVSTFYFYKGIGFELKSDLNYYELANEYFSHNKHNEGKHEVYVFHINGITISENDFNSLKLHKSDCEVDSNYCTEHYVSDSVVLINLHAKLRIPICIEGIEYDYKDTIPTEYLNGDKLHFRRERHLFRKDRIIVEKEEKLE